MGARSVRAQVGVVVATFVVAAAVAACSSSTTTGTSSGTTTDAAATAKLLGPTNPATGTPLRIGYVTAGQTQAIDSRPDLAMAQATVKYMNEHLGGVAGRPVQLVTCFDQTTPAGATACANQMVAAKVPIVLQAEPANAAAELRIYTAAKVPYFAWAAADASMLESPNASVIGNPLTILAAPIKLAKDDGVSKVAMIYTDVPAAAALKGIGVPLYKNAGIGLVPAAVPLGTPDLTPQVQAALSAGAKEFLVVGDNSLCVDSIKALKTLGYSGKVVSNMNCLTGTNAVPGGFDGLVLSNTWTPDPNNADVALYRAIADTYAPGVQAEAGIAEAGYGMMMGFARAMKGLQPNEVTSAGMAAQLKAMAPETMPLLSGETFQCNRQVDTLLPAVCSNGSALVFLDPHGGVVRSETFDATPYLKLG
jgi:branched-chain amino acid transport system substrate-binding protein